MIGLEYILNIYDIQHQDLAEKLGIRKQNINLWIKGKQNVSKKYLPTLSEMFGVDEEYFQKELDDIDKLIIQKEKLKRELKPEIIGYNEQLMFGDNTDLVQKPIYNTKVVNDIELEIEKAKIVGDFREAVSNIHNDIELQMFDQIALLLKEHKNERILEYTIDAVSHYYNVLPDWVGGPESDEFVYEFLELAHKHDE
jgi:transcriptional regulator with XRE-family HTH domain